MTDYIFNDCRVCINPTTIELTRFAELRYAEKDGRYYYGYSINYASGGVSSPCMYRCACDAGYATEHECIIAGLAMMQLEAERHIAWCRLKDGRILEGYESSVKQVRQIIYAIQELINTEILPQAVQLSLFD